MFKRALILFTLDAVHKLQFCRFYTLFDEVVIKKMSPKFHLWRKWRYVRRCCFLREENMHIIAFFASAPQPARSWLDKGSEIGK